MNERDIFIAVLHQRDPAERAAFLHRHCAGDQALRDRVAELLREQEQLGSFLERPAEGLGQTGAYTPPTGEIAADLSEKPGTVIGPYKLLEQIGEGGFGVVFMAEQQQPIRRKAALKILKPGMDTRQVVARFEAERQALAIMDHPNIARVFAGGETVTGRPYFVMELVRGIPITDFCDQARLSIRERLQLFVNVCQAVQHAHQKGIIHRDLKPSNVMVTLHDGTPMVKVIDFGIAKAIGQQLTDKTLFTHFSQMIGTPLYMSPEQAGMSGLDADTRSDIYSLGVLLYELLTGTTPFDRERLRSAAYDEMRRIIREEEPARPSTRISTLGQTAATVSTQRQSEPKQLSRLVRGELDWIVMKALEKDRNRRYESASAFAADVQRYLHDEPVQACPPSAWYRFCKFARRRRAALFMAACVFLALAGIAGSLGWAVRDRGARQAKMVNDLELALGRGELFQEQGKQAEARAAFDRAELLANELPPNHPLKERLDADEKDMQLLAALDAVRLAQAETNAQRNRFAFERAVPLYRAAFRDYGMPPGEGTAEEAAARIGERPAAVREAVLAALDEWIAFAEDPDFELREPHLPWLQALQKAAEPEGWEQEFRDASNEKEPAKRRAALEKLATAADVEHLPVRALTRLALRLQTVHAGASAVALLRRARRRYSGDFRINELLGWALLKKQPGEAVRYLMAAVALRPDSAGARLNLGYALANQGERDEAIAEYQKASALDPNYAAVYLAIGLVLEDQGKRAEAIAQLRKAIALDPKYAMGHLNLGVLLARQGKQDEAIAEDKKAVALNPKFASAHTNLGSALWHQGKRDEAIAEYRKATELDPKYSLANTVQFFLNTKRYAVAAQLYAIAFAADAKLADDLKEGHRYHAARAAALAGCGQGEDTNKLDDKERTRLRRQALDWLRADLAIYRKLLDGGKPAERVVRQKLQQWESDPDLAGLREKQALAKLPAAERQACEKLWADVADLLKMSAEKK